MSAFFGMGTRFSMRGLCTSVALAGTALAWGVPAGAQTPTIESTLLRCEPVYLPTRAVWPREVELVAKDGRLSEVRIDGVPVYTFSISDSHIITSVDNERIQIDIVERNWRSDFRGQASGQGLCMLVESTSPPVKK